MITAPQYLTELLMIRKAHSRGKTLPFKFWNVKPYKLEFVKTLNFVRGTFKLVDNPEAVINVYTSKQFEHVYTLKYPGIDAAIQAEDKKLNELKKHLENVPEAAKTVVEPPRKSFGTKSKLSKLRELEGNE